MEENITFKHRVPVQLRFSDVDQFGHVNNSVYFSLYDLAKTTYFKELMGNEMDVQGVVAVAANIQANFLSPVFFSENIEIQTTTTHLGNKSFTLLQRAVNTDTNEIKCECQTIVVAYSVQQQLSVPIPMEFKTAIADYEEKEKLKEEALKAAH